MDKLFKHLFRAIILLQTDEDNHSHNLSVLLQSAGSFYMSDVVEESDKRILEEINLGITHHYLYKNSRALLKKNYYDIFDWAYKLISVDKDFTKGRSITNEVLKIKIEEMCKKLEGSLGLFIKLVEPVFSQLKQLNDFS